MCSQQPSFGVCGQGNGVQYMATASPLYAVCTQYDADHCSFFSIFPQQGPPAHPALQSMGIELPNAIIACTHPPTCCTSLYAHVLLYCLTHFHRA